ncbi:myosin light chain 3, skeletal muscle isoform-like [Acanthaster planci]|uniref:Myosin light chain 3, skeletal muscle isoform-like n=1 Tax=Acanthaster planci TaxID=133434 RepID=A0A8B7Y422_ACAPL|nr:myosin light chain 3, skeletal muscle isoform-like [Acanthaster planci]
MAREPGKFTDDQVEEFKEIFNLFDKIGDHKIPSTDVGNVCRCIGHNPTLAEIKKLIGKADEYDRFTFEEFLPMLVDVAKSKEVGVFEDYLEGLKVFDKEANGLISAAELRHVLTALGEKLTDDEMDILLAGHENEKGMIDYEKWIKSIMVTLQD